MVISKRCKSLDLLVKVKVCEVLLEELSVIKSLTLNKDSWIQTALIWHGKNFEADVGSTEQRHATGTVIVCVSHMACKKRNQECK